MLGPQEDWSEYRYILEAGTGDQAILVRADWRIWKISVIAGAANATIVLDTDTATVPAGSALTLSPNGMYVGSVTINGAPLAWTIEWIRRNSPIL